MGSCFRGITPTPQLDGLFFRDAWKRGGKEVRNMVAGGLLCRRSLTPGLLEAHSSSCDSWTIQPFSIKRSPALARPNGHGHELGTNVRV